MSKVLLFIIVAASFILSGCATTKSANILNDIKVDKLQLNNNSIQTSSSSEFIVYIDKEDRIKFLCYSDDLENYKEGVCDYYDESKHAYSNLIVEEEVFGFAKSGYKPLYWYDDRKCGYGNVFGLYVPLGAENKWDNNSDECQYRYTKVAHKRILSRVIGALVTFGTAPFTMGNLHSREFDYEAFKTSISNSNINSYRDRLYEAIKGFKIDGGFDIVYLTRGNFKSDLEDKYEELLDSRSKKAGILLVDEESKNIISIVNFAKYKEYDVIDGLSLQIGDIMGSVFHKNLSDIKRHDILKHLPHLILPPATQPIVQLTKSEFETESEFNKRVEQTAKEREAFEEALLKEYALKVEERNEFIEDLEASYKEYIDDVSEKQLELYSELKKNVSVLMKVLFLANISAFKAQEFNYNAQTQQLFFRVVSKSGGYSKDVVTKVSASVAKTIKQSADFKIIPDFVYKNSMIQLQGLKLREHVSGDSYDLSYTDINYTPKKVTVVLNTKRKLIDSEVSKVFQDAKQKEFNIDDTKRVEISYKEIVNRVDAKAPEWYLKLEAKRVLGFGRGDTLAEAKSMARDDLAMMIEAKIVSVLQSEERVGSFNSNIKILHTSNQISEIELNSKNHAVDKQERLDGYWYVTLEYIE